MSEESIPKLKKKSFKKMHEEYAEQLEKHMGSSSKRVPVTDITQTKKKN